MATMAEKKKTLLFVDDDAHLLSVAAMYFSGSCLVLQAADGGEGVRKAIQELPDLIVLDMMLPQMSGRDVLVELQSGKHTSKIPVIVMTAFNFSDEDVLEIEREKNVKFLLRKPFAFDKLKQRVDQIFSEKTQVLP